LTSDVANCNGHTNFSFFKRLDAAGNLGRLYDMIYLLTTIGLTSGDSSTVHIYTKTPRTIQLTTLFGRRSGIRTQSGQTKINDELTA